MANDMQQTQNESYPTFGAQLKAAREALGLSQQHAASQLRLNEKLIGMLESETHDDIPTTFLRGYIRSYGRLLHLSEEDIAQALTKIHPDIANSHPVLIIKEATVTSSHYYMQAFTVVIVMTLVGLVGAWWYNHSQEPLGSINTSEITNPPPASASVTPIPVPAYIVEENNHANEAPKTMTTLPPIVVPLNPTAPPTQENPVSPSSEPAAINAPNNEITQPTMNEELQPVSKKSTSKKAYRAVTPSREDSSPYYDDPSDFE